MLSAGNYKNKSYHGTVVNSADVVMVQMTFKADNCWIMSKFQWIDRNILDNIYSHTLVLTTVAQKMKYKYKDLDR